MRYRDITCDRFRLPPSHPILAIDPVDWFKFQQMAEDNPATRLIGRDDPRDERMVAYVACASKEIRRRLEDRWG
jgi:hypothetical protein